ncbi:hypothetical protein NB706_002910 [Xanthomonas sacchari]|nr:hypothetical protein [Xanthomonas sacchari]
MTIGQAVDLCAPEPRPRHPGQRQEQQQHPDHAAGKRMQIAPEQPLRRPPAHRGHAAAAPARPPQVHAGEHQQDRPASGHLDQRIGEPADVVEAVQAADRPGHGAVLGQLPQHPRPVRVHVHDLAAAIGGGDGHFRRGIAPRRRGVAQCVARLRGQRRVQQPLRRQRLRVGGYRHGLQRAVEVAVDRLLIDEGRTGQRQPDQQRQYQQAGIEMPAPHGAVEACRRHSGRGRVRRHHQPQLSVAYSARPSPGE